MEKKKFKTNIEEYAYIKQWLSHNFSDENEMLLKKKRLEELKGIIGTPSDRELAPFNQEIGRTRSATMQHIVREIYSIPQRILIDQEVYRRIEGRKTPNFKFLLIPPISDSAITRATQIASLAAANNVLSLNKKEAPDNEEVSKKLKTEILNLLRSNSPQVMIAEIMYHSNENGMVSADAIAQIAQKYFPEFPVNPTPEPA